ncbi:unnamed protein product [Bursaphelenchus okinawaensis]|uniref:Uncharacterized protein n=1 Tax=Bursaphelenchus okinawaensis TaxID=465554 RepID=A0A811K9I9_9BILA|nr:unnamed protein product [Bursaphelenchus okinawaensis]CAG9097830.1 unnamed protein product [Bursaphelenchus okinawaensis]
MTMFQAVVKVFLFWSILFGRFRAYDIPKWSELEYKDYYNTSHLADTACQTDYPDKTCVPISVDAFEQYFMDIAYVTGRNTFGYMQGMNKNLSSKELVLSLYGHYEIRNSPLGHYKEQFWYPLTSEETPTALNIGGGYMKLVKASGNDPKKGKFQMDSPGFGSLVYKNYLFGSNDSTIYDLRDFINGKGDP